MMNRSVVQDSKLKMGSDRDAAINRLMPEPRVLDNKNQRSKKHWLKMECEDLNGLILVLRDNLLFHGMHLSFLNCGVAAIGILGQYILASLEIGSISSSIVKENPKMKNVC
jgi:hypothetical protein